MSELTTNDMTPKDFDIPQVSSAEILIKRPIRKFIYPILNKIQHSILNSKFDFNKINPDLIRLGQRGNDYERHRAQVNKFNKIHGSDVFIAGCGTCRDIHTWMKYQPKSIHGVDLFNYKKAWNEVTNMYSAEKSTTFQFSQGYLEDLSSIKDDFYDIVASDAVFEHLKDIDSVLAESKRILKKGGVIYATFGPLWYSWGGDHLSGFDDLENGYNHLTLSESEYESYLDSYGNFSHSEDDGRTWIKNDLFSRLKPAEYISALERAGFKRRFVSIIVDDNAYKCLPLDVLKHPKLSEIDLNDLLISGMTIIYEK